jgi:hypothetical protein
MLRLHGIPSDLCFVCLAGRRLNSGRGMQRCSISLIQVTVIPVFALKILLYSGMHPVPMVAQILPAAVRLSLPVLLPLYAAII